jgi:uncharacterized protein (TIGR03435 family)
MLPSNNQNIREMRDNGGMTRWVFLLCAACLIHTTMSFTQPAATPLAFEVASIKHAESDPRVQACLCEPKGRVAYRMAPLKWVIERAYNLQGELIIGPDWLDRDLFDIDAKLPDGVSMDQLPVILQRMLAERFQLAAHTESRVVSSFALGISKGGSKLTPPPEGFGGEWRSNKNGIHMREQMSLDDLARYLAFQLEQPVTNETGLAGVFAVSLDFSPEMSAAMQQVKTAKTKALNASPPLSEAIQEQLGLKLNALKRSMPALIIDHVAKVPTEN